MERKGIDISTILEVWAVLLATLPFIASILVILAATGMSLPSQYIFIPVLSALLSVLLAIFVRFVKFDDIPLVIDNPVEFVSGGIFILSVIMAISVDIELVQYFSDELTRNSLSVLLERVVISQGFSCGVFYGSFKRNGLPFIAAVGAVGIVVGATLSLLI